jgi:hypothetical protein
MNFTTTTTTITTKTNHDDNYQINCGHFIINKLAFILLLVVQSLIILKFFIFGSLFFRNGNIIFKMIHM